MKPYFETELGRLYNGDCLEVMKELEPESVDLVVTSPPYDNLREYKGYVFSFKGIAQELYRVIKDGGIVVWVVGDATVNGSETGTSFEQALYFKEIGFNLHDTMIYKKINPIPLTHNRYEQYFEYMFILSKGKPKTFNPITERCVTSGNYTQRRNTGRVSESATRNRNEVTTTRETKYRGNVWNYVCGNEKGETGNHPAPFPERLSYDHIISWSNKGDVVLDIFNGSGTTSKISENLGRKWIGIEISLDYCKIAKERIERERAQRKLF